MILTVTPNPSLDLLYEADGLKWDDANRIAEPRRRPGGQGVNLARAAIAMGGRATAIALVGGSTGLELEAVLAAEGTHLIPVSAASSTRLFIGIRDHAERRSLLLNSRGPHRSEDEAARMLDALRRALDAAPASWVACCGSLPPGFDDTFYARAASLARAAGALFVPDCDGEPLKLAATGADLLVPNHHEAGRLVGKDAGDVDAAASAAHEIATRFGVPLVAITLGANGAVLTDRAATWHAAAPVVQGSTVGAGDAFLAGLLIELEAGRPPQAALKRAVAAGAAAVTAMGVAVIDAARVGPLAEATKLVRL